MAPSDILDLPPTKSATDALSVFRDFLTGGSVSDKIDANISSGDYRIQMEGVVAGVLQNKFGSDLLDVNRAIFEGKRQITEADIVLKFATVEVKTGENVVNLGQTRNLQQALGKPVVVYAPQATPNQIRSLEGIGAIVVKNTKDLLRTLEQIKR
jgi:hypothetical protein